MDKITLKPWMQGHKNPIKDTIVSLFEYVGYDNSTVVNAYWEEEDKYFAITKILTNNIFNRWGCIK